MKRILLIILTLTFVFASVSVAYAKPKNVHSTQSKKQQPIVRQEKMQKDKDQKSIEQRNKNQKDIEQKVTDQKKSNQKISTKANNRVKEKKQSFKINGSPVIKYGNYKLPLNPVIKGMGATVTYDKDAAVLTVTKGTTTIVINLKDKTVTVNGVADTNSGIFTAKNNHKMNVLIKYIADKLGVRVAVGKDDVTTVVPGLDFPTNVTVTPVGGTVVANTLNSTTLYLTASANVVAGQAVGGKAELYVGSKLVATDSNITATDTTVNFTTSDETPANSELQAAVPDGGVVTVKLYNSENKSVVSTTSNPTLVVDYTAPTVTSVTAAAYSVSGGALSLTVSGAGAVGDIVDVTKLTLVDPTLNKYYQLTSAAGTGSTGVVTNDMILTITLGSTDKLGLTGFGKTIILNIAPGALIKDVAGNTSPELTTASSIPVTVID